MLSKFAYLANSLEYRGLDAQADSTFQIFIITLEPFFIAVVMLNTIAYMLFVAMQLHLMGYLLVCIPMCRYVIFDMLVLYQTIFQKSIGFV